MTKYLIIDTETSGLFDFSKQADAEGQPRMCSVAFIVLDEDGAFTPYARLIKPDGWTISPDITAINGLTTEKCEAEGVPVREVLDHYTTLILAGHVLVTFNAQFDAKLMRGELRRARMPDLFEQTPNICLMRAAKNLGVQKQGEKKSGFPKLSDLWFHYFPDVAQPAPHTAAGDAQAAFECFLRMRAADVLPAPEVHYAKEGSKSHQALKARENTDV